MKHHGISILGGLISVVVVSLVLLMLPLHSVQAAPSPQNAAITLRVEAGYDGLYRTDRWLPVLITVNNTGPDVSGELRVTSAGTPGLSAGAYTTRVDLPRGAAKEIFLYITLSYGASQVKVELVDERGILADDTRPVRPTFPADLLFVVMTESPRGAVDLQNVSTATGSVRQVNWRIDNLPPNPNALRGIDALVLTDIDTGKFSTEQRRAIRDWVTSGGQLIVTGGPNWQRTQAGVTDLLPVQPTASTTLTTLPSVATFAGRPADTLAGKDGTPVIVAQGDATPDARILASESGIPMVARRKVGEGTVDYIAIDPGTEPLASWQERGKFWLSLISTTSQQPSWADGIINASTAQQAANLIKGVRLPDVFQLCGFLLVYIILIGPLNYLILKRMGRRELAWLTMPVIIFACSAVSYVTGFSLRGTQATLNRLAVVQVSPNSDRARVDGVVGILAPRRGSYAVSLRGDLTMHSYRSDNMGVAGDFGPTIRQFPNDEAPNVSVDAGITAVFGVSGYTEAPKLEGKAELAFQAPPALATGVTGTSRQPRVAMTTPRMTGSINNTTGLRLENVVALGMGGNQELGTLEPGRTASFDFLLQPQNLQSPPVSLGRNTAGQFFMTGYGSYGYNNREVTVADIMGRYYNANYGTYGGYNLGYGETAAQQEYRRRQALLRAVAADIDPSGGRGDSVYIAGWVTTSPINMEIRGVPTVTEDSTLYIFRLPVSLKQTAGLLEIPGTFLTWMPAPDSTRRELYPYNMNISSGDKASFRYVPLPLARLKEITRIDIVFQNTSYRQGTISLWDWVDNKWVDVRINGARTEINEPSRFVGPEDAVQLQIEPANGVRLASIDRIDLVMYGRQG